MKHDEVMHPSHYLLFSDGTEVIDVIKKTLSKQEYMGYLKGNILKYRLRAGNKGEANQCIAKANNYKRMMDDMMSGE